MAVPIAYGPTPETKEDALTRFLDRALAFAKQNTEAVVIGAIAIVAVSIATALFMAGRAGARERSANAFAEAYSVYRAQVDPTAGPYKTEQEHLLASAARLKSVAEEHRGTEAG